MKVLVIGGTGIIGTGIVEAAVGCGHEVLAVSRQLKPIHNKALNVKYLQRNWYDDFAARELLENITVDVIVDGLVYTPDNLVRDLKLARGHCKQFIYISTAGVYEQPTIMAEENASKRVENLYWSYSKNKREAEIYLEQHGKEYPFMITTIRPTFTYGDTRIPCAMVGKQNPWTLLARILEGKPIVFIEDGKKLHAITHISIFANAVVGLFLNPNADMEFFHVCDDKAYTWEDVINAVGELLGVVPKIVHIPIEALKPLNEALYVEIKYNKMQEVTFSNRKIKSVVSDVCYHVELKDGLESTIEHLQTEYAVKKRDIMFDRLCDMLLLRYDKYNLTKEEYAVAKKYIEQMPKEEKHFFKKEIRRHRVKYYIMKHVIHIVKLKKINIRKNMMQL